jgi:two-component system, NarL family, sensor histidine kinase NreB
MWPQPHLGNLVVRIPLVMLGGIFVAEAAIMSVFALTAGEGHNRWLEVVVDSTVLTLTVAPLLYWLIVRPLRVVADERSRLLAHVFEIQDAERQQVARDLHDEIGQSFTSLLVQMRVLEDAPTLDAAKSLARELRELSGNVYDQIRSLARGLHPSVLDDLGLVEALRRLAEDFETTHGTTVSLHVSGISKERLNRNVETTAYRIVQESLTNCAKYAQAANIDVSVIREPEQLTVTIADNGQGFDVGLAMNTSQSATFGLTNMRERALLLKGSFVVRSRPGNGTTVTLRLPLGS